MPNGGFLGGATSVGGGIGLQAQPEGEAAGFSLADKAESQVAEQRRAIAERARAAKVKSNALTEKELERITPYQTAIVDQPSAQKKVNEFLDASINDIQSGNPNAYWSTAKRSKELKEAALASQPDIAQEKQALGFIANEYQKNGALDPSLEAFQQAITTPDDRASLKELAKNPDPLRRYSIDPNNGKYLVHPIPTDVNVPAREKQILAGSNQNLTDYENKTYANPKGGIETFQVNSVYATKKDAETAQKQFGLPTTPASLESHAEDIMRNDPKLTRVTEANLIGKEDGLPVNYYDIKEKDPSKAAALLKPLLQRDLEINSPLAIKRNIQNPNAPQSASQKQIAEGKVRVVFDKNTRTATFNIEDAKNAGPLSFGDVRGIPLSVTPTGPGGTPELNVQVEIKPKTNRKEAVYGIKKVPYDKFADKLKTEIGFDYYAAESGKNPEHGKLITIPKVAAEKKTEGKELKVTKSQVEEAAKAKRLSVEDYLKAAEKAGHKIIVQ